MASPAEELVMLGTHLDSHSRFKSALAALSAGSTVRLIGPLGSFTVEDTAPSVVMMAQGIGITPFRSILRQMALSGIGKRTTLQHVGTQHPFRPDTEADATHASYPTTRQAFEQELDRVAAAQPEATFMLAGATAFVNSAAARLKAHGVNASQLKRDTFYGYTGPRPAGLPGTDDVA